MSELRETEQIKDNLRRIIISVSGMAHLTPEQIRDDAPLFGDQGIGLDSIDILEFVVRLEKIYGLKIRNDEHGRALLANINSITDGIVRV